MTTISHTEHVQIVATEANHTQNGKSFIVMKLNIVESFIPRSFSALVQISHQISLLNHFHHFCLHVHHKTTMSRLRDMTTRLFGPCFVASNQT